MSGSRDDGGGWLPDDVPPAPGAPGSDRPARVPTRAMALVALSAFGIPFCLTLLFFAMRVVMVTEGGFVAVGGPYEIAHPAPTWVWVFPVSIVAGMAFGGLNVIATGRAGGFDLVIPAWSATFLSLGWNFLEFGLRPPGGGLAWGWIICAVAFLPMGAIPLWGLVTGRGFTSLVASVRSDASRRIAVDRSRAFSVAYAVMNVVAILSGVAAGWAFFRAIAG